jgi:anti-anti-sigma factor
MSIIDVTSDERSGVVTVKLVGELDISSASRVERELKRAEKGEPPALVLDLSGLEFLDSTGLRMIVAADQRAREEGRRFALIRGTEAVQRVFRITFLEERLPFVDDSSEVGGVGGGGEPMR